MLLVIRKDCYEYLALYIHLKELSQPTIELPTLLDTLKISVYSVSAANCYVYILVAATLHGGLLCSLKYRTQSQVSD